MTFESILNSAKSLMAGAVKVVKTFASALNTADIIAIGKAAVYTGVAIATTIVTLKAQRNKYSAMKNAEMSPVDEALSMNFAHPDNMNDEQSNFVGKRIHPKNHITKDTLRSLTPEQRRAVKNIQNKVRDMQNASHAEDNLKTVKEIRDFRKKYNAYQEAHKDDEDNYQLRKIWLSPCY